MTVRGLWVGAELSLMEQLSISSFLANGHEYELYAYDDLSNVPKGTTIKDGNEVLPEAMIFQYASRKSYSGFSNYFRYKLLLARGGWWVDTDVVCLRPFDFQEEYVFSSEPDRGEQFTNSGVIKVPALSDVMSYTWSVCLSKRPEELVWGEVGPKLMGEAVQKFSLERYIKPYKVFCPFGYREWERVLDPEPGWGFDDATYSVHLWNEMWRRGGKDKNQPYHPDSLYERLKRRYLPQ